MIWSLKDVQEKCQLSMMPKLEKEDGETLDVWFSKAIDAVSFDDIFKD